MGFVMEKGRIGVRGMPPPWAFSYWTLTDHEMGVIIIPTLCRRKPKLRAVHDLLEVTQRGSQGLLL